MEPAVRSARTQSGIAPTPVQNSETLWSECRNYGCKCGRFSHSSLVGGNGNFRREDRAPKIATKRGAEPIVVSTVSYKPILQTTAHQCTDPDHYYDEVWKALTTRVEFTPSTTRAAVSVRL